MTSFCLRTWTLVLCLCAMYRRHKHITVSRIAMLLHDRNTTSTGSKAQQVVLTVKFAAITLLHHVEPAACSPSATASSACTWTMFCRYALPEGAGGPAGLWSPLARGLSAAACPAGFGGPGSTPASLWWDHPLHCCSSQLHTLTHITGRQSKCTRLCHSALIEEKPEDVVDCASLWFTDRQTDSSKPIGRHKLRAHGS